MQPHTPQGHWTSKLDQSKPWSHSTNGCATAEWCGSLRKKVHQPLWRCSMLRYWMLENTHNPPSSLLLMWIANEYTSVETPVDRCQGDLCVQCLGAAAESLATPSGDERLFKSAGVGAVDGTTSGELSLAAIVAVVVGVSGEHTLLVLELCTTLRTLSALRNIVISCAQNTIEPLTTEIST